MLLIDNYKVYVHINTYNNKLYIGVTKRENPNRRWQNGYGYKRSPHFASAIEKYGWNSFKHIILFENLTQEIASIVEQELIKKYNTDNPSFGYNIRSGGISGYKIADSTKEKLREMFSGEGGYWHGIYGENHPRYGKRMSQEAVNAIREKNKKENWSEETKKNKEIAYKNQAIRQKGITPYNAIEKAAEYHRGRKMLDEQKKKISETLKKHPPMLGLKMSEESRKKMSKVRKEKGIFAGGNNPSAKTVIQLDKDTLKFIAEYECTSYAAKAIGVKSSSNIRTCCKNRIKTCGGYKWMYKDDYEKEVINKNDE